MTRRPSVRWAGTLLYLPVLYAVGWLAVRPLVPWLSGWRPDQVDLLGTAVSFLLLLLTLPRRLELAWAEDHPWRHLGVARSPAAGLGCLLRGAVLAMLLLLPVVLVLLASGQARWSGSLGPAEALNALLLMLGVGFAEELVFRGWLWGELAVLLGGGSRGVQQALLLQAAVFALVHTRFNLGLGASLGLLGGLTLLALALALQRRSDEGALWGAVGLHGGLVGGWFALLAGPLQITGTPAAWLFGPGGTSPNPLGGLLGWLGLLALVLLRRPCWRSPAGTSL